MKAYWTQGVARWQLLLAYVFIAFAFAFSIYTVNDTSQANKATIERECRETNAKNVSSKATLRAVAAQDIAQADEAARERKQNPELFKNEIADRRDATLALLDTVLPVKDCGTLVR